MKVGLEYFSPTMQVQVVGDLALTAYFTTLTTTPFKVVLTGVNELAARLGAPMKFHAIGLWSDWEEQSLYGASYYTPTSPYSQWANFPATEGLELSYSSIPSFSGERPFLGGWVYHFSYGYILHTLLTGFPYSPYLPRYEPRAGDTWRWNVNTGELALIVTSPAGQIFGIYYWDPVSQWLATPPALKANQALGVRGWFKNTAIATQTMRLDAILTTPSGAKQSVAGSLIALGPGAEAFQDFFEDPPLQVGSYKAELVLGVI